MEGPVAAKENKPLVVYTYDTRHKDSQALWENVIRRSLALMDQCDDFIWVLRKYTKHELGSPMSSFSTEYYYLLQAGSSA